MHKEPLVREDVGCSQTPLIDLMRSVPKTAVLQWLDGNDWRASSHNAPVGRYLHEAAAKIERLERERGELIDAFEREAGMTMSQVDWNVAALTILRVIKQQRDHATGARQQPEITTAPLEPA